MDEPNNGSINITSLCIAVGAKPKGSEIFLPKTVVSKDILETSTNTRGFKYIWSKSVWLSDIAWFFLITFTHKLITSPVPELK